jgi:hypothetical protein
VKNLENDNSHENSRVAELLGSLAYQMVKANVSAGQTGTVLIGFLPSLVKFIGPVDLLEQQLAQMKLQVKNQPLPPSNIKESPKAVQTQIYPDAQKVIANIFSDHPKVNVDDPKGTSKVGVNNSNKRTSVTIPNSLLRRAIQLTGSRLNTNKLVKSIYQDCPPNVPSKSKWVTEQLKVELGKLPPQA